MEVRNPVEPAAVAVPLLNANGAEVATGRRRGVEVASTTFSGPPAAPKVGSTITDADSEAVMEAISVACRGS